MTKATALDNHPIRGFAQIEATFTHVWLDIRIQNTKKSKSLTYRLTIQPLAPLKTMEHGIKTLASALLKRTRLSWIVVAHIGRLPILRLSLPATIIVPIIARISNNYNPTHPNNISSVFFWSLDGYLQFVPDNLLKLYWSGLVFTLTQSLFLLFCPPIVRRAKNYREWRSVDDTSAAAVLEECGRTGSTIEQAEIKTQKQYNQSRNQHSYSRPIPLIFVIFGYATSLYLLTRVILSQILEVFKVTSVYQLIL